MDGANGWVAVELSNVVIIGIYAWVPHVERYKIWESLCLQFDKPATLTEDFNMLEGLEDRYLKFEGKYLIMENDYH